MQDEAGSLIDRITARRAILGRIELVGRDLGALYERLDGIAGSLVALEAREDPVPVFEDRLAKFGGRIGQVEERLNAAEERLAALGGLAERLDRIEAAIAARGPAPAGAHDRMPYVTTADLRALGRVEAEAAMRARCMVVPVDETTALCRILGRYKMYVDRRDIGFAPHLMFEGFWEYWLTEFIWRNVKPGEVALDVGANHGYYSVLMADLVGPEGGVHAFEPNPRLLDLMERTFALNGFWHTVRRHGVAVAEASGPPMTFAATEREPKNGRLLMPGEEAEPEAVLTPVPVVALDEAIEGPVGFVKIDVEGAEELAWRGMQRLIDRSPDIRIVMEFNPGRCRTPAETLAAIAARFALREVGFDAQAHPVTAEEVLGRAEDTLLYLSRLDPA
ncbi:FkbM family methyltransferase [Roseomonas sp. JC162]|uniref:FkbM family methyltransferase n=1 Tax=Neoroseomonas marina TaxID=1232220 RepID=A0A848E8K7_9PROT|nr:FkbM family methyltransferase [Neoroseomonas marina]NMJ40416.1 FkbM family methyltransferase [Neoroseomonas marina]